MNRIEERIGGLEAIAKRLFPQPATAPERIQINFIKPGCERQSGCGACEKEATGCSFIKPGPVFNIYGK